MPKRARNAFRVKKGAVCQPPVVSSTIVITLNDLPEECLQRILSYLSYDEVAQKRMVSLP